MEWTAMILLGAYHGINPGMGWLFAVALGMQQGDARGVWRALPPIALGHIAAVSAVVAAAWLAEIVVPLETLKPAVAFILIAFGLYRLKRARHPRYGGMQVGFRDLTIWSFLMASAHGAGLMIVPFIMSAHEAHGGGSSHVHANPAMGAHAAHTAGILNGVLLVGLHTLSYFVVMALVAWIVYRRLGLALLRTAWFNLDWLWSGALVATGVVVLLV